MPKQNFTSIDFILDRSYSMMGCRQSTIDGFNEFLNKQKSEEGDCVVSLHQFDHAYQTDYESISIDSAPDLTEDTFVPRGQTALLDAIGKTINSVGLRLSSMPDEERPDTVIIAILTDGQENQSTEFNPEKIKEMITHQTDVYNWEFIFLAANQDAVLTGDQYGISKGNSMSYATTSHGTQHAFSSVADGINRKRGMKRSAYASGASYEDASIRVKSVDTFTDEDRKEQSKEGAQ